MAGSVAVGAPIACSISLAMSGAEFQSRLKSEFDARRLKNPRYSLRAFAAFLEADHSTLSQILRGRRPVPAGQVRKWGKNLGMAREEVAMYVASLHVPEDTVVRRQEQLRHWTAEALAIVADRTHWRMVELTRTRGFKPDCRWIAEQVGVGVDEINVALSRLLRLRLLAIGSRGRWRGLDDVTEMSEAQFQRHALVRVRELAAEDGVALRGVRKSIQKESKEL